MWELVCKNSESVWELPKRNGFISSEMEQYLSNYYFVASLIFDMKSFFHLFVRIDHKYRRLCPILTMFMFVSLQV